MKRTNVIIICVLMLLSEVSWGQTTEDLFTYNADYSIAAKSKFVDPINWNDIYDDEPVYPYSTSTISLLRSEYVYELELKGMINDGGEFDHINIYHKNDTVLSLRSASAWDVEFPYFSANFRQIRLSKDAMALIFIGYNDATVQPGLLTVVVLDKGKASLVFNKKYYIREWYETQSDEMDGLLTMNTFKINLIRECPSYDSDYTRQPDMIIEKVGDKLVVKR